MGQVVRFQVEGRRFAADIGWAREAVLVGQVTPVPTAPPEVIGLTQVRGHVLALLDLPRMLGGRPASVRLGDIALRVQVGDTAALLCGATDLSVGDAPADASAIDLPDLLGRLRRHIEERPR
jgi:chemotaxis signal transduction protein